jgi:hypothetical protein
MSTVRMDLVEAEAVVISKAEDDPAAIGRIGPNVGVHVPALVISYEVKMRAVRADSHDVG